MNINSNSINIFDMHFALDRAFGNTVPEQHRALQKMVNFHYRNRRHHNQPSSYITGDYFNYHKTEYYKYNPYIAVILTKDNKFFLQTFKDNEVGELYDFETDESEIYRFFMEAGEELTVIENKGGKLLLPEFDNVMHYATATINAHKKYEKDDETVQKLFEEFYELRNKARNHLDENIGTLQSKTMSLASLTIDLLCTLNEKAEEELKECTDDLTVPLTFVEKDMIIFGLYLKLMKYGLEYNRFIGGEFSEMAPVFNNMLREMHTFVSKTPELVHNYLTFMKLSENEEAYLLSLLDKEGILSENWFIYADSILNE